MMNMMANGKGSKFMAKEFSRMQKLEGLKEQYMMAPKY